MNVCSRGAFQIFLTMQRSSTPQTSQKSELFPTTAILNRNDIMFGLMVLLRLLRLSTRLLFYYYGSTKTHTQGYLATSIEQTLLPSSTRAELAAILLAFMVLPRSSTLTIYTDSSVAIRQINFVLHSTSPRNMLKMSNHFLLALIKYYYLRFRTRPLFVKVPAHTGDAQYRFNATVMQNEQLILARNLVHF
jgi:ribonuclease HI